MRGQIRATTRSGAMPRQRSKFHVQSVTVYAAADLRVVNGANDGDALSYAEDLVLDDVYELATDAPERPLRLVADRMPPYRVAQDSETGSPGADLYLDACLTFMSPQGDTTEALVLVEVTTDGDAAAVYLMPLSPLAPKTGLTLVGISPEAALQKFAQMACVSFTAGTHITMATGEQRRVEDLKIGDRVLTRDAGPQDIRWLGQTTLRATGSFAPVLISAGVLNNLNDLRVSPDHRLFIYQRSDELGTGRAELLVRARHLVNADSVRFDPGGFVDYYQMLFDQHQIVFAEGIAVESMMVDSRTSAALPPEMQDALDDLLPDHSETSHDDLEVERKLLRGSDTADRLRRSSTG